MWELPKSLPSTYGYALVESLSTGKFVSQQVLEKSFSSDFQTLFPSPVLQMKKAFHFILHSACPF
jgi:hypothetical protein